MAVLRVAVGVAILTWVASANAGELNAEQARRFVAGKTFAYSCFEGTRGAGKIQIDGSVHGTVQMQGNGPVKVAALPANTLYVREGRICASVRGMSFQPCFNVSQTSPKSFRGALSGFGFAYCDFVQRGSGSGRSKLARNTSSMTADAGKPLALSAAAAAPAE
jgi:hypothetical protein